MANTEHRNYPLPSEAETVRQEFMKLMLLILPMVDLDVAELFAGLATKASVDHPHGITDVEGLADALAGKMPADKVLKLAELVDVEGVAEAPDGYIPIKTGTKVLFQSAAAALGAHMHTVSDVTGLEGALLAFAEGMYTKTESDSLLAARLNVDGSNGSSAFLTRLKWLSKSVGEFYFADTGEAGVELPPADPAAGLGVWVDLTAGLAGAGQFNAGKLSGESVSGSAPNITATAVVNAPGSPMHGQTIVLLNTERRFMRPGSPGTKEASQNLSHGHTGTTNSAGDHSHSLPTTPPTSGTVNALSIGTVTVPQSMSTSTAGAHTHTLTTNNSGGSEARPNNIGIRIFRRVG